MTIAYVTFDEVETAWASRPGHKKGKASARVMRIARVLNAYIVHVERMSRVAARLGTTAGEISNYRGLVTRLAPVFQRAMDEERMVFKTARSLIRLHDPDRQVAIGTLFLDGSLGSGDSEPAVKLALDHPEWDTSTVYSTVKGRREDRPIRTVPVPPELPAIPGRQRNAHDLPREILWTAGAMKMGAGRRLSTVDKVQIVTTLHRLREAADELAAAVAL